MTIRYCRSNGYGEIDVNAEEFQLGRKLFEAQGVIGRAERALAAGQGLADVDQAKLVEVARWFCRLVSLVGHLRADYDTLQRCLHDPFMRDLQRLLERGPQFLYVNDGQQEQGGRIG